VLALHQQENTHFSMISGMRTMNWVPVFHVYKRIISAVKRVEFVSYRMPYIILKSSLVSDHCSEHSCPKRG
jgi:hypothetical protein